MKKLTKQQREKLFDFIYKHIHNILNCGYMSHFVIEKIYAINSATKHDDYSMQITTEDDYLRATLGINLEYITPMWLKKDYDSLIDIICHEVTHIITGEGYRILEIQDKNDYYQERVTEHTSRWLQRLYRIYMDSWNIKLSTGGIVKLR